MKILVVSPHPDDETLGAGGSLLRFAGEGNELYWLIATEAGERLGWSKERMHTREDEIGRVTEAYGFSAVENLRLPATELDRLPGGDVIDKIRESIARIQPELVLLPDRNDAHTDHAVVFDCCMSVLKAFRCPSVKKIWTMEILSESNFGNPYRHFAPDLYVDISETIERKIGIMKIYASELGQHPFPRSEESIRALATLRGAEAGCRYAEAFHVIKEIV